METISVQLKPETVAEIDHLRRQDGRPRSQYIRRIIEHHVAFADSLAPPREASTQEISHGRQRRSA
jgi:predicted DNA-binding protein